MGPCPRRGTWFPAAPRTTAHMVLFGGVAVSAQEFWASTHDSWRLSCQLSSKGAQGTPLWRARDQHAAPGQGTVEHRERPPHPPSAWTTSSGVWASCQSCPESAGTQGEQQKPNPREGQGVLHVLPKATSTHRPGNPIPDMGCSRAPPRTPSRGRGVRPWRIKREKKVSLVLRATLPVTYQGAVQVAAGEAGGWRAPSQH